MNKTFDKGKEEIARLCKQFATNHEAFVAPGFKKEIEDWRDSLARNIALRNRYDYMLAR